MDPTDEIVRLVRLHLGVYRAVEATDAVVRGRLGYEVRREIPPWTMMGPEELAEDELAVWQRLDAGTLNAVAAVAEFQVLMTNYYEEQVRLCGR